jgi:peptide/nickel transport system substrate-binding protein
MSMRVKILCLFLGCILVLSTMLISCGPKDETTTTPVTEKPQYGGSINAANNLGPNSLDPVLGTSGGDAQYFRQMFDSLVAADSTYVSQPSLSLAESWEIPDPNTMIFRLRKGIKFHDGTDFNADAVKFNIERILDPATAATPRASLSVIESVEIVDSSTVKFHLKQPWASGLGLLADRGGTMSSPTAVNKLGKDYGFNPVGTGPFKLSEYVSGSYVKFVRNDNYWGKDASGNQLPYINELTINIIPDEAVRYAALQTGELDIAMLPYKNVDSFKEISGMSTVKFEGADIGLLLGFNIAKSPLDNVDLRRAVAYAVNPEAINQALYFGKATVAKSGLWCPNTWAYDPTVSRPYYDQQKAKEFLKNGGQPEGFEMEVVTFTIPLMVQQAEMIQSQLAAVGIKINLTVLDTTTTANKFFVQKEYPLLIHMFSRYPEPDYIASLLLKGDGYYNPHKTSQPEMDNLIANGASTYDLNQRKTIYRQITEKYLNDCWFVPMLYNTYYYGYKDSIGGIDTFFGWDAKMQFRTIWLKQ